jgi:hypothetical protein
MSSSDTIYLDSRIHDERYYTAVALFLLGNELKPNEVGLVMETFNIINIKSQRNVIPGAAYISDIFDKDYPGSNFDGPLPRGVFTANLSKMWELFGTDIVEAVTKNLSQPIGHNIKNILSDCAANDEDAVEYMRHHRMAIEGSIANIKSWRAAAHSWYTGYFDTWEEWYKNHENAVGHAPMSTGIVTGPYADRDFVHEVTQSFGNTMPLGSERHMFAISAITVIMTQITHGIRQLYLQKPQFTDV